MKILTKKNIIILISTIVCFFVLPQNTLAATPNCAGVQYTGVYNALTSSNGAFDTTPDLGQDEIQSLMCQPIPQIKIPGLSFSAISDVAKAYTESDGNSYLYIPFLGEYLAAVYRYSVAAMSVVAVIVIILSGVQWMIPGNADNIGKAKKRIIGALTGLLLAVGSYVILYTINPELVQFKNLKVLYIKGDPMNSDGHSPDGSSTGDTAPVIAGWDWDNSASAPPGTIVTFSDSNGDNPGGDITNCIAPEQSLRSQTPNGSYNTQYLGFIDACTQPKNQAEKTTRQPADIKYIGLHLGAENTTSNDCNGTVRTLFHRGYSTHYVITQNGTVCQLVEERLVAQHGVHNNESIGIDLETNLRWLGSGGVRSCFETKKRAGVSKEDALSQCAITYTDAQYTSLNNLINDISARNPNVKRTADSIMAHCRINHSDPPGFDWSKIQMNEADQLHEATAQEACHFIGQIRGWLDEVYATTP